MKITEIYVYSVRPRWGFIEIIKMVKSESEYGVGEQNSCRP